MIAIKRCTSLFMGYMYGQTSNISHTSIGNEIVDHSDVVRVHLHSRPNTWLQWVGQRQLQDGTRNIKVLAFGANYISNLKATVQMKVHNDLFCYQRPFEPALGVTIKANDCWLFTYDRRVFVITCPRPNLSKTIMSPRSLLFTSYHNINITNKTN